MSRSAPRVVLGEQPYRVDRFWGELPDGFELGLVSTVAVAPGGEVVVARRNPSSVLVLGPDGTLGCVFGAGTLSDPHGVNVTATGRILAVDRDAHEVLVFSLEGEVLMRLGERDRPRDDAPFNHPTSAAMAADGEIYVADGYGNSRVHRFSAGGEHLASWGRPGTESGAFSTPHSVWVDGGDRVLVVDRENDRVEVFSRDGAHLTSWRGFHRPMDICEDGGGRFLITDQTPRLSRVDAEGRLTGRCRPVWNVPHGVAAGPGRVIYLTEMQPSSLTRLVPLDA